MSSRAFSLSGIVLRMNSFGEQDRFLTLLTPENGKLTCLAKGIRNIKSRRNPHCELMNRVTAHLWKSRRHHYLTQATTQARFHDIKKEMNTLSSGLFMLEATERLVPEDHHTPGVFPLLNQALELMNFYPEHHINLREAYLVKLLQILGHISSFRRCSQCREPLPQRNAILDREHSTISCYDCVPQTPNPHYESVPLESLKLMNFILSHPIGAILKLKTEPRHLEVMGSFGRVFLYHNLPHRLRTEEALALY